MNTHAILLGKKTHPVCNNMSFFNVRSFLHSSWVKNKIVKMRCGTNRKKSLNFWCSKVKTKEDSRMYKSGLWWRCFWCEYSWLLGMRGSKKMLKLLDQDCPGDPKLQRSAEICAEIDKKIRKNWRITEKELYWTINIGIAIINRFVRGLEYKRYQNS